MSVIITKKTSEKWTAVGLLAAAMKRFSLRVADTIERIGGRVGGDLRVERK
jgi:hypothetical protein